MCSVQCAVGLAVVGAVESVAVGASGGGGNRRGGTQAGERGLRGESLGVVSCGNQQLPGGFGADSREREEAGVVWVMRVRSSASASAISSLRCWWRLARRLSARLTAVAGSVRSAPGRPAAKRRISSVVLSERSGSRTAAGR